MMKHCFYIQGVSEKNNTCDFPSCFITGSEELACMWYQLMANGYQHSFDTSSISIMLCKTELVIVPARPMKRVPPLKNFIFYLKKHGAKKRFNIDYYGPLAADSNTSLALMKFSFDPQRRYRSLQKLK
jgi:hypothetical protein